MVTMLKSSSPPEPTNPIARKRERSAAEWRNVTFSDRVMVPRILFQPKMALREHKELILQLASCQLLTKMFATIPSFLSAQPPRPRAMPRSPTAPYSPPPSPTFFSSPSTSPLFPSSPSSFFTPRYTPANISPAHFTATSPARHAVVLNWEDVLAPTTLLTQRVGLQPSHAAMENARALLSQDVYLQQALASIEEQTISLLTTASALGPVFIVTETSLAFMEATCAVFFPRLAMFLLQANIPNSFGSFTSYLNNIRVVSPPLCFTTPLELSHWKSNIFQSVCIDQLQRDACHPFSLINVSASSQDAVLCVGAAHKTAVALAVPKCVQVADPPSSLSLETFYAQLQTLNRYLGTAAVHKTAFSTRL